MLSSDVGGKPETSHGGVTYHKVTLKEERNTAGTKAKEQVVRIRDGTRTARRTRRSGAMLKRTEKRTANGRQSKPKDHDRDKAKYEEKHSTEDSCSQPVPKHPRTDADVQQGQYERKLGEGIATIPTINFNEEIVEYKKFSRQLGSIDSGRPEDREDATDQRSTTSRRHLSA